REVQEESGLAGLQYLELEPGGPLVLDVDVHRIPARRDPMGEVVEPEHEHHDVRFLLGCCAEEPLVVSEESHEIGWFTTDQVRSMAVDQSVLRMLQKAQRVVAPAGDR